ncbi:hypothetical protein BGM26_18135 [Bacillus sp. FJAT-29790]|uniref:hypothetical protein n=1 Tax=Bacillus sp. FJAT-29790 TaxID=1895002 RepID=UPI001C21C90F|nr:hypothetical protein [Bacillus sp. FJAT-29790]MBU8880876.1 hypothetical protein [Bacillus sp. FJAT-29790]
MKKIKWIIIAIPLILLLIFSLTYIPHKVMSVDTSNVSKVAVFDGNTGYDIEITDETDINYIINNLNEVTFQKGKPSVGYMGYSFRTTIFDKKGKTIKELIINSNDTIRYKGFFYTSVDNLIDYDYIEQLVRK